MGFGRQLQLLWTRAILNTEGPGLQVGPLEIHMPCCEGADVYGRLSLEPRLLVHATACGGQIAMHGKMRRVVACLEAPCRMHRSSIWKLNSVRSSVTMLCQPAVTIHGVWRASESRQA